MLVIWLLRLLMVAFFFGGIALVVMSISSRNPSNGLRPMNAVRTGAILGVLGFFGFFWLMSATYVPGTHMAVVENTTTGNFKVIGPGIHVWPMQPNLVPFTSKVTQYNMRRTRIEIGTEDVDEGQKKGVPAGSSSAGNPTVYIEARGWATPNPALLVELHRRYGSDYANSWVERNWVTAIKAVQGQHPYDYLIGNRDRMATEVEEELQDQLFDDGKQPLVYVSQLAITNFDFDNAINQQLDEVANKEFERQRANADIEIARQQQEAEKVKAETRLAVATKDAEAAIAKARGEAEAVRLVNEAISSQGREYIDLKALEKWDGKLPVNMYGSAAVPFVDVNR